jgi:hypothetical protein
MKKQAFFIIILFTSLGCFAQWAVGPRVGINFHTVTGKWSSEDDTKNRFIVGPVAGAVGSYTFSELLMLSGELSYETMGQKNIFTLNDIASRQAQETYFLYEKWHALSFVVLLNLFFTVRWFAHVGFANRLKIVGFLKDENGNKIILKMGEGSQKASNPVQYVDPTYNRRWDLGMYVGGGYQRAIGPGNIRADLRFGYGLLDLNKFEDKDQKKTAKDNGYKGYHSMNIMLSVAYMFELGNNK